MIRIERDAIDGMVSPAEKSRYEPVIKELGPDFKGLIKGNKIVVSDRDCMRLEFNLAAIIANTRKPKSVRDAAFDLLLEVDAAKNKKWFIGKEIKFSEIPVIKNIPGSKNMAFFSNGGDYGVTVDIGRLLDALFGGGGRPKAAHTSRKYHRPYRLHSKKP